MKEESKAMEIGEEFEKELNYYLQPSEVKHLLDLYKSNIRLAEESLVERVREEIYNLSYTKSDERFDSESTETSRELFGGVYNKSINDILSLPILSTSKPKGDE